MVVQQFCNDFLFLRHEHNKYNWHMFGNRKNKSTIVRLPHPKKGESQGHKRF